MPPHFARGPAPLSPLKRRRVRTLSVAGFAQRAGALGATSAGSSLDTPVANASTRAPTSTPEPRMEKAEASLQNNGFKPFT